MNQTKEVYSIRKQHNKGGQLKERNLGMNFSIFNHRSSVIFTSNHFGLHLREVPFKKVQRIQKSGKMLLVCKKFNWYKSIM